MTLHARGFGCFISHLPQMRLMTVRTAHVDIEVGAVFSHFSNIRMASQTVSLCRLHLARGMQLVAFTARKLHRRLLGNLDFFRLFYQDGAWREIPDINGIFCYQSLPNRLLTAVAKEALIPRRSQILGFLRMAVQACEDVHPYAVNPLSFMALRAKFFCGEKTVETRFVRLYIAMTLCTLLFCNGNMPHVERRCINPFCFTFCVAYETVTLVNDNLPSVACRYAGHVFESCAIEQLHSLRNRQVVAHVTIHRFMNTGLPR